MTTVGFDFGTTNSLVSVIRGQAPINILDPSRDQPFPSIVAYEGTTVVVGEEAKQRLGTAGLGVHGNIIRSPKIYLGQEDVHVGGRLRTPEEIVSDVVSHVRDESVEAARQAGLGLEDISRAVVTMPVKMSGDQRRQLRGAFGRSGIDVVQFVHEPFAALYGYLRSQRDAEDLLRRLDRRLVLVVDWGGGTLDLTLCRVRGRSLTQILNLGADDLGGDHFDEAIQNAVIDTAANSAPDNGGVDPDARLRLLHACETAKILLSETPSYSIYVPSFWGDSGAALTHRLERTALEETVRHLVDAGTELIRRVLDRAGVGDLQISLCLATGGMVNMPLVRSQLHQLFGTERVVTSHSTQTLVAEGAAWVAHDEQPLVLSRSVELQLARNSFMPLVKAGTTMPRLDEADVKSASLYCSDPTDGKAHFQFVSPRREGGDAQLSEPRDPLAELVIQVDEKAPPLRERLSLDITLDHDLILTARATSTLRGDTDQVALSELEFGLELPVAATVEDERNGVQIAPFEPRPEEPRPPGSLIFRANLVADPDAWAAVPGEIVERYRPDYFAAGRGAPPEIQVDERLYYRPCAICGRRSNDPDCRCLTRLGWLGR